MGMGERLLHAAARVGAVEADQSASAAGYALRPEQQRVLADFATYLTDVATRPAGEQMPPFCRIIQPPRTGKTVVAGHIIRRTGLTATFVVPTRTLVEQSVRELARQLPGTDVGCYYGEQKQVVREGVNVVTYAILERDPDRIPAPIRHAALVFVDEAHHAMTARRLGVLTHFFDPLALRVGLTATPDYSDERRLVSHFPDLIHEITLEEALDLDLLAPLRVWVAEVDVDGSTVSFVAGDYQQAALGRLMSSAPFFRAVELFRYRPGNAQRSCLVACSSRQQAYDLGRYLATHRPAGNPAPAVILGETPRDERERTLADFEAGAIDTLIQVGVLLEGWSSPRCKLLIDLCPSLSRVRATQKYFRVMTRDGAAEAHILVLLPKDLPELPILPMELFGASSGEYFSGDLLPATLAGGGRSPIDNVLGTPVTGVEVKKRILLTARLEKPALDRTSTSDIRAVLESCTEFDPQLLCGVHRFRGLFFRHPLFLGRGDFLLRWLRVPATRDRYYGLLGKLYPEIIANRILAEAGDALLGATSSCGADNADDWAVVRKAMAEPSRDGQPEEPFASTWRALTGTAGAAQSPEDALLSKEAIDLALGLVAQLPRRKRVIISGYFGLFGAPELTLEDLADSFEVSRSRVGQLVAGALRRLRHGMHLAECEADGLLERDARQADLLERQAEARAARASHTRALLGCQGDVWQHLPKLITSRSQYDRARAAACLRELHQAAQQEASVDAFQSRLAAVRAATATQRSFWISAGALRKGSQP